MTRTRMKGFPANSELRLHSIAESSLLRGLEGETPFLCLTGQGHRYPATVHELTLQGDFNLLLGCMKQSLLFLSSLFILVDVPVYSYG